MNWILMLCIVLFTYWVDVLVCDSSGGNGSDMIVRIPMLIQHIIDNDFGTVYDLISMGEDPNVREIPSGWTPLIYASNSGNIDLVQHLLMAGADVNTGCADGWTPLMFASVRGNIAVMQLLLDNGANIYQTSFNGATALGSAHLGGHNLAINLIEEALRDSRMNEIFRDNSGTEAVILSAAHDGNAPLVEKLLLAGHDPNTVSLGGWTPLMLASAADCVPCVLLLLEAGAKVDTQDNDGWTALMFCAHSGHSECAKLLVQWSADVLLRNHEGHNSLQLAHVEGNAKTFHDIVSASFCEVMKEGDVEYMMLMIADGVNPNYVCASVANYTPLIVAVKAQNEDAVSLLLDDERVDVNAVEEDHWSALMFASLRDNENIIRLLLKKGADREILTKQGYSVIRLAQMFNKDNEVVLGMLENGIDFTESPSVYIDGKKVDDSVAEANIIKKIEDSKYTKKSWSDFFKDKKEDDYEKNDVNHYIASDTDRGKKGLLSSLFGWA